MNLTLALAQLEVNTGDFSGNTSRARLHLDNAAASKADILIFPEMWTGGFDYSDCRAYSLSNYRYLEELQKFSDETKLAVGGSYLLEEDGKYYNQFVLVRAGETPLSYRKIHLFRLMEEDLHFSPGEKVSFFETRWGPISLAVCYDLRFPELFLRMREHGAGLVVMAAGWPAKRIEHWKTLLRARAIENQCFIAAVNCVGGDPAAPFGGASAIIGPWGETITEAGTLEEEFIHASIETDQVDIVREKFPFFKDRLPRYSI